MAGIPILGSQNLTRTNVSYYISMPYNRITFPLDKTVLGTIINPTFDVLTLFLTCLYIFKLIENKNMNICIEIWNGCSLKCKQGPFDWFLLYPVNLRLFVSMPRP